LSVNSIFMDISFEVVSLLIISGLIVGFINTLAGGATVISITFFLLAGLPPAVANGTNRIPIVMQNLAASFNFKRQELLDVRLGLRLSVPMVIGSVTGALAAGQISDTAFRWTLAIVLFMVLWFMMFSPVKYLKGEKIERKIDWKFYLIFLFIGFYAGFIYVGLGYLLLAAAIAGLRYDIVRANALKGFIALVTTPFSLIIFMLDGNINYSYGLIHSVGNIIGAYIASKYASGFGVSFLKWFLICFILLTIANLFGIISIGEALQNLFRV